MISIKRKNNEELLRFEGVQINEDYPEAYVRIFLKNYSKLLIESEDKEKLIEDFSFFSELNYWVWDECVGGGKKYDQILKEIRRKFQETAKKFDLILEEE